MPYYFTCVCLSQYCSAVLSVQSCLTLCKSTDCSLPGFSVCFAGKNTGVACHFLLQGIFLIHVLNLCLLHWQADYQADYLPLYHLGAHFIYLFILFVAYSRSFIAYFILFFFIFFNLFFLICSGFCHTLK